MNQTLNNNLNFLDSNTTVFSIDTGKTFDTVNTLLLPMPHKFKIIPPLAVNIGLIGLQSRIQDSYKLLEFMKKQVSYKIKVLFSIKNKFYVEVFNDENISLNSTLNPRFQSALYGGGISEK